jgi:hypothetical protein
MGGWRWHTFWACIISGSSKQCRVILGLPQIFDLVYLDKTIALARHQSVAEENWGVEETSRSTINMNGRTGRRVGPRRRIMLGPRTGAAREETLDLSKLGMPCYERQTLAQLEKLDPSAEHTRMFPL